MADHDPIGERTDEELAREARAGSGRSFEELAHRYKRRLFVYLRPRLGSDEDAEDLAGLGKEINQSKFVEKASMMFFLAQEKQDNLQVRVQITADSPESAKNMADIAQGLIALGRLSEQDHETGFASFTDGIQVKLDGKTMSLEFDRPSREIADLLSRGRRFHGFFD